MNLFDLGARRRRLVAVCMAAAGAMLIATPARAGGTGDNVLIIIDPSRSESLYVGNYYKAARNVPDRNVLYMQPAAADFAAFVGANLDGLLGTLQQRGINQNIDYVIVTPGAPFFLSAPNLVNDGCSAVRRFATGSVYTMARIADEIAAGGVPVTLRNQYYSASTLPRSFDSNWKWLNGGRRNDPDARRYFIGAMLGYSGERGNTVEETIEMIDRSIAADGARPDGTFYFMKTNDQNRSGPRDPLFGATIRVINGRGGRAEQIDAVLPAGRHDVLGIMTGAASPDIDGTDMTILPGAFCDHLTSFAGRFDTSSQTKMSRWIANGASGSLGAVEEPCNYPGKFPVPRMHYHYFLGLSLGEAVFRNLAFVPFQMLIYGDPLTRPFAYLPSVSVPDAP
ncbi:MAG: TIGR03790 family protein, partial [Planctomycetes bacterium]|nr:TIGR03790 family protein [Planctomycetota bacterium]